LYGTEFTSLFSDFLSGRIIAFVNASINAITGWFGLLRAKRSPSTSFF
jgi:hypothetical protein